MESIMMAVDSPAKRAIALSETQQMTRDTGSLLARKIWLPKVLYAALPYFYLVAGIGALIATMYIGHWSWILPHYIIFSAACLHMGTFIYRRRKASRKNAE
jgi:hypothetical protein